MLYNLNTSQLKLIDPKGDKGNLGNTYAPIYYDLAKLSHSFIGLYDYLAYDKFEISFNESGKIELQYDIDNRYRQKLQETFIAFIKKNKWNLKLIRLMEASLFISMIPLHKESNKRMVAQLIQSIRSFHESEAI